MFRYLVLGLLRDGQPYHGYALMKAYRERSGVSISTGNFYRELQRLVSESLVQTVENPPGADSRRSPYEITESGVTSFESWLVGTPINIASYDDELSSRAVFVGQIEPEIARSLLDHWRESVWVHGKTLEREREVALTAPPTRSGFNAREILLARRLRHVAADLEFVDELSKACLPKLVEVQESVSTENPGAKAAPKKPKSRPATAKMIRRHVAQRHSNSSAKKASRRR